MGQYGFAKRPDGSNGTTPEILQKTIYSQYVNAHRGPKMRGGLVSGRSNMTYAFSEGVGLIVTGPQRAAYVTWDAGTTALVSAPTTGDREDIIWANEHGVWVTPASQFNISNACILDRRIIRPGAQNTSGTTSVHDNVWAIPYGASLGWLGMFRETGQADVPLHQPIQKSRHTWCNLRIFVPTDRRVSAKLDQAIYGGIPGGAFNNNSYGSMKYWVYMDNTLLYTLEVGYNQIWDINSQWLGPFDATEGVHTFRVEREHAWGADPKDFGGGNDWWLPGFFGIKDDGVKE